MNTELQALVVRYNGIPIHTEGVVDGYTYVQFKIQSSDFNVATIQALNNKSRGQIQLTADGFYFNEQEAYTACGQYGDLLIDIESFVVIVD
jgi:hypothetical protein